MFIRIFHLIDASSLPACLLVAGGWLPAASKLSILMPVSLKGGPEKRHRDPVAAAIADNT